MKLRLSFWLDGKVIATKNKYSMKSGLFKKLLRSTCPSLTKSK